MVFLCMYDVNTPASNVVGMLASEGTARIIWIPARGTSGYISHSTAKTEENAENTLSYMAKAPIGIKKSAC